MMPYSEVNIGDIFSNPMHRGFGKLSGLEWYVVDKKEKMIAIQGVKYHSVEPFGAIVWKRPSDRMFSEHWRVYSRSTTTRVMYDLDSRSDL